MRVHRRGSAATSHGIGAALRRAAPPLSAGLAALWAQCSVVDVLVFASLGALPRWLTAGGEDQRRQRQRELRWMIGMAVALPPAASAPAALALGAPWPWGEFALGGVYLLAWMVSLRLARGAFVGVAKWLGAGPRLAGGSSAVLLLGAGAPLLFTAFQIHRVKFPQASAGGVSATLVTDDGVRLAATLYAQSMHAPAVVLCHGVGANLANVVVHARLLHQLGCHVLAFDFRGHGESDGHTVTFGARETRDVAAAVSFLRARADVSGIALVGISMGGAVALLAAAECRVAGVFTESAFADLRAMATDKLRAVPWLAPAFGTLVACAARVLADVDLDRVNPVRAAAALPPTCALVLLHAGDDHVVPRAHGERLATATSTALEVFTGAEHGLCQPADPARYRRLLHAFLLRAFAPPR